jgi:hypothetical protein
MRVDMTDPTEDQEDLMESIDPSGLPIYVILFPDGTHELLSKTPTATGVAERLRAAAERYPSEARLSLVQACLGEPAAADASESESAD